MKNTSFEYAVTQFSDRLPAQAYAEACRELSPTELIQAAEAGLDEAIAVSSLRASTDIEAVVRNMLHQLLDAEDYQGEDVPEQQAYADALTHMTPEVNPLRSEMLRIVLSFIRG